VADALHRAEDAPRWVMPKRGRLCAPQQIGIHPRKDVLRIAEKDSFVTCDHVLRGKVLEGTINDGFDRQTMLLKN
jgi:hypothetical protein